MKICKTYTVKIEDPDGDAVLVFRRPKLNLAYEKDVEISKLPEKSPERAKANLELVLSEVISVKGMTDEDGKEVGVQDLRELGIDAQTLTAIIEARSHVLFGSKVSPEKKDSSSES